MVDRRLIKDWLSKADDDFLYAKACLENDLEFFPQICFHFHQAAEKYLKAYVIAKELDFRKIHDLTALLEICKKDDGEFVKFEDAVRQLTPFYVQTRYPEFIIDVGKIQAESALETVEQIGTFVKSKLGF